MRWHWRATQYNAGAAAQSGGDEQYSIVFDSDKKFKITAPCGSWKGKYAFGGRSLSLEMNRNWLSSCRRDEVLKIFLDDLERARAAYVEDKQLQITLAGSEGIMYFEQR